MANKYQLADSATEALKEKLIHTNHVHLFGEPVVVVFFEDEMKKNGKTVLGQAKIVSGINAWAIEALNCDSLNEATAPKPFHLILLWRKAWAEFTPKQREALLDHELSHCIIEEDEETGDTIPKIAPHDIEEFNGIVERHGAWLQDIKSFLRSVKSGQPELELHETEPPKAASGNKG